jgi:membrane-associated phospholipid phosphatase
MHWLLDLDCHLFRFLNLKLSNPICDVLMPFASGNAFFFPTVVLLAILLFWKGGSRGVVFVLMLGAAVAISDGVVCRNIKHAVGRPRPFMVMPDVHRPGEYGAMPAPASPDTAAPRSGNSMPSSHAANWFAATMIAYIYYRRSLRLMLPLALLVSFSRIYIGVHYPSDVLAGAILGAGSAAATAWSLNGLWQWAGRRWFPLWWARLPSLLAPALVPPPDEEEGSFEAVDTPHVTLDQHWVRLGYIWIVLLLLIQTAYLAGGTIQLIGDEAYQWLWSKHLALSYYSKPPLIAYTQFVGTSLWGDTAFGVRFFAPVIAAVLSFSLLRFFAREVNARAGFFLLLLISATPLMAVGTVLMTVDPLSVLFWMAAVLAGWNAVQEKSGTREWLWVGLWMGLGFLSKYTQLFQWLCWAVFFVLWRPARKQLRRPGPYLALLVNCLCAMPVLIWNWQRGWVTVSHVAGDARIGAPWKPTLRYFGEFLGSELLLLNPVFFVGAIWAAVAFWRRGRHNPRMVYFFSMGAPLFLAYMLYTFHSRVLPNWIAPSLLPLFCLMVMYWDTRWRLGMTKLKPWLIGGLLFGLPLVILGHNTDLVGKLTGRFLPVKFDPLHRVREWDATARLVDQVRQELKTEGKPVFIIADHYSLVGEISFYLPEARARVQEQPLVYYFTTATPDTQFYFWSGYGARKGENAVFVRELERDAVKPGPAPRQLEKEFESVTDLGVRNVMYHGRMLLRPLQFFACRGLK